MNGATPTTQDTPDKGRLQINLVSDITAYPIQGARISISYTGIPETPLEQLTTDSSGQTDMIDLAAPPLEYSLDPENEIQPYSEYTLQISAAGYESVSIAGTEILPHVTALHNGTLAYTQISHKTYYKPEDVMAIVAVVEDKKKGHALSQAHRLGCQYTTATLSNAASKPSNVSINNKTTQL